MICPKMQFNSYFNISEKKVVHLIINERLLMRLEVYFFHNDNIL